MTLFIPVDYHGKKYPQDIKCEVKEVAGHLDKTTIPFCERYSLHTEYSFAKRKLESDLLNKYPVLKQSHRGVPQLWYSKTWAKEFSEFIFDLTNDHEDPEVIEIHPPFRDYCPDYETFCERYSVFEDNIRERFPKTIITMENRAGAQYPYKFLMSSVSDMAECCKMIESKGLHLMLAADYPQFFTAENYDYADIQIDDFISKHSCLDDYKQHISSIHLWGKRKSVKGRWIAHSAGIAEILPGQKLTQFLELIKTFYDDDQKRYFVPEINASSTYLEDMVRSMSEFGIEFTN